ncbi:hypothetical protein [Janibacter hoylei]|uniref:hypothetical protein n=1 Tax=Janibacter hoylei TaxID=364298 RepID=UPI002490419C|nr:hypothetical protein [Janibacter hoylei]
MPRIHVTSPFAEERNTPVGPPSPAPAVAGHAALVSAVTLTVSWVAAAAVVTVRRDDVHAYQVVADASRALGSRVGSLWPWWIAWLLMGVGSVRDTSGGLLADAGDVDGWVAALQVNAVVAVVALVLWWRIVRAATAAAQQAVRVTS